jgi:hypothetical protein
MMSTRALTTLMCWAFLSTGTGALQEPPRPANPGRLLEIQAVAVDDRGNPVTDLRPQDVEVWIAGVRVPLESLGVPPARTPEGPGRLIVLVLDDITLEPVMVSRAREVANRFASQMAAGDRLGVVMLNSGRLEITSGPAQARSLIDRFRQSLGALPVDQLGAQLLKRVADVARAIVEAPERRKIIVGIGSGWLLDTPVPPGEIGGGLDIRREWFDAMRAMGNAHATYYVVDPAGVGASRQMGSYGLAHEAGGYSFVNTNDFNGAVDKIVREADNYYVIRVGDPPFGRKAVVRELNVKSLRRDVTIRAPRGLPGGGGQ